MKSIDICYLQSTHFVNVNGVQLPLPAEIYYLISYHMFKKVAECL